MKINLNRVNANSHFEGKGKSGMVQHIDPDGHGASPMEFILMGLGGCNAVDIVNILKKQRQKITDYKMEVEGEREQLEGATPFKSIHVKILLEGEIDEKKAARAAQLSFEKYCSVSMTMQDCVDITYSLQVNGKNVPTS